MCIERFLVGISGRSVKCVQLFCDRLDLTRIVYKRNFSFLTVCSVHVILLSMNVSLYCEELDHFRTCVMRMM